MKEQKSSQVSVEYMLIMGFVVIMTVPLLVLYYTYTQGASDEIITSQVNQISRKIVDAAESVYFLGIPSQTTIKVYMPKQIAGASIDKRELVLNVSTKGGISEIVMVSSVNLTSDLNPPLPIKQGLYSINLNATAEGVRISYK